MAGPIYAFSSQSDLDRISQSVRDTEARTSLNPDFFSNKRGPYFARITALVDDTDGKRAKGISLDYDISLLALASSSSSFPYDSISKETSAQHDIFSNTALTVDDEVELIPYVDATGEVEWLVRESGGGGAQRPIIQTAGVLAFGGELEGLNKVVKTEFIETTLFKALLPWGDTVNLPDDFVFTADIDTVSLPQTQYYTEAWPTSMYAFPQEIYPSAAGITDFQVRSSNVETSTLLYDSDTGSFNLILDNFDFANASTAAKQYYTNFGFPVSFSVVDQAFYFTSPLIG